MLYYKDRGTNASVRFEQTAKRKAEEMFKITKSNHAIVTVQPRNLRQTPQCIDHTSAQMRKMCRQPYTQSAQVKPPTCANCNGAHPANFKGCTYKQEPFIMTTQEINISS